MSYNSPDHTRHHLLPLLPRDQLPKTKCREINKDLSNGANDLLAGTEASIIIACVSGSMLEIDPATEVNKNLIRVSTNFKDFSRTFFSKFKDLELGKNL